MKLLCKSRLDCSVKTYDSGDSQSVHMTCGEDAGSGFSQTAEFHILLWTGTKQSYYLHPSVSAKLRSGKKPSLYIGLGPGRGEGASLVESAFPLSFSLTPSLPHNESVSPARSES